MTRKALLLFIAASVIWGSSFLFIRLAVEQMPPATVVFGRTLLGAAFLVPLAASRRAFRDLRPVIVPIIVVAVLDMAAPTFLTAWGSSTLAITALMTVISGEAFLPVDRRLLVLTLTTHRAESR